MVGLPHYMYTYMCAFIIDMYKKNIIVDFNTCPVGIPVQKGTQYPWLVVKATKPGKQDYKNRPIAR